MEGLYFQKVLRHVIKLGSHGNILTLEDFVKEENELKYFLSQTCIEDRYVKQYHFSVDIPWISIGINLERVQLHLRFLANHWIGIAGNTDGSLRSLRYWVIYSFILTVYYLFDKIALITSKNLGKRLTSGWIY